MRAKMPDQEGFVERDGVTLYYEIYGDWPRDHRLPAALEHRPRAGLQGAVALFQRTLPLHHLRRSRQWQIRSAGGCGGLLPGQLRGRCACGHGCDRCGQGYRRWPFLCRHAGLHISRALSRSRQGCDTGRYFSEHRAGLSRMQGRTISARSTSGSRAGTNTTAPTGFRTIPILPNISFAISFPNRTRPSRSRMVSTGRAILPARCWPRRWRRARSRRRLMSAKRCIARYAVPY